MRVTFHTLNRTAWLRIICFYKEADAGKIELYFNKELDPEDLESMHIVSLACLIEHWNRKQKNIILNRQSKVGETLWGKYRLREYWGGKKNYAQASDRNILNLWRVVESEKDLHAIRVSDYLKQNFFQHKDLSPISNNLAELYYNAFDHAKADGNIFSMVLFDETTNKVNVAVCDFGIGVAQSVKKVLPELDDEQALIKAIESEFTTRSKSYNAGLGLDNIRASCTDGDSLFIISNEAFLVAKSDNVKTARLNFCFSGTLVFYVMSISHFGDEETVGEFSF